jgi:hypothetical protein
MTEKMNHHRPKLMQEEKLIVTMNSDKMHRARFEQVLILPQMSMKQDAGTRRMNFLQQFQLTQEDKLIAMTNNTKNRIRFHIVLIRIQTL